MPRLRMALICEACGRLRRIAWYRDEDYNRPHSGVSAVKLYTKTGDDGETGLMGGTRVPKNDPRVAAYGEIDETNAALGLVLSATDDNDLVRQVHYLQDRLFVVGAELANPNPRPNDPAVRSSDIEQLEKWIDSVCEGLPPLKQFILPGGSEAAARLHLVRTICRRAERTVVALSKEAAVDPNVIIFLNRLSDLCFALARRANHRLGISDIPWRSPST